jgi:hypothetical protein
MDDDNLFIGVNGNELNVIPRKVQGPFKLHLFDDVNSTLFI